MIFIMLDFSNKSLSSFCFCKIFFFVNFFPLSCTPQTDRAQESLPLPQLCQLPAVRVEFPTGRVRHLWELQLNWFREQRTQYSRQADDSQETLEQRHNSKFLFYSDFSLNRLLISFLSYMYNHLVRTITKPSLIWPKYAIRILYLSEENQICILLTDQVSLWLFYKHFSY